MNRVNAAHCLPVNHESCMGIPVVAPLGQAERLMTAWLQDSLAGLEFSYV